MGQRVVPFEIMGAEASALQRFYGALFGWTFNNDSGAPHPSGLVDRAANLTGTMTVPGTGGNPCASLSAFRARTSCRRTLPPRSTDPLARANHRRIASASLL